MFLTDKSLELIRRVPVPDRVATLAGRHGPRLWRALGRVGVLERRAVFAMAVIGVALYAFVQLAEEVMEDETRRFDYAVLLLFRDGDDLANPLGPSWVGETVRDFTALGSTGVLAIVTVAVIGYLLLSGSRRTVVMLLASVGGGIAIGNGLKYLFDRARPDLVPHAAEVYTLSFPSSHAMMSAVVYLTLGVILARTQSSPKLKVYFIAVAIVLAVIVGLSRIYLGVHWPTDVLAGWAVGTAWALICWLAMVLLQSRGQVEPEHVGTDRAEAADTPPETPGRMGSA